MKQRYLEVTYRNGKPLAAYLYLPRPTGAKAARTDDAGDGLRVDRDGAGAPIGIEITSPASVTVARLLSLLASLGVGDVSADELAPLAA